MNLETFEYLMSSELIPEFRLEKEMTIVDLLIATGMAKSKREAKKLIEQRGVKLYWISKGKEDE